MMQTIPPDIFDNSYARLPDRFYSRLNPTPVSSPALIRLNTALAIQLNLKPDELSTSDGINVLAGNQVPEGAEPLAMAYAGHQFGGWAPQLGDGRAILLGEVVDKQGIRQDIQLKGSGPTPYSRMGDGRAWIGPVLREFIVSEAMAAMGVPTTRALAAVTTGDTIHREGLMPGAVLTRVARSHIRVGTFEYFAARRDVDGLRLLADHVIDRHYPHVKDQENRFAGMLEAVIDGQCKLIARWQGIGFIHGVMNTDNMSVAGDTIDYGPCAFMDTYESNKVFSSIDQMGRYSYQNQPRIAQWNLAVLAQSLLPLIDAEEEAAVASAQELIDSYPARFAREYLTTMRAKLGLLQEHDEDNTLIDDLLACMESNHADFTLTFRRLSVLAIDPDAGDASIQTLFDNADSLDAWLVRWRQRLTQESSVDATRQSAMTGVNPAFVPRNHRVEAVIQAALNDDLSLFDELMTVLSTPYAEQPEFARYADPPQTSELVHQTFCGT